MSMRAAACVGLVVAALAGGCGGGSHPPSTRSPAPQATPRAAATPLPAPSKRCGPPEAPARAIRFKTADGVMLNGAIAGSGPVGAVLIHEYPGPMCGWWPYAAYLSRHGVRALLFDLRCFGDSECKTGRGHATADVAAAMKALREDGARSVALVGASMGGAIAVVAAARLHPAALVDLSGERDTAALTPGIRANAGAAARDVTAPALFVVARKDRYVPVSDMRAVYERAPSRSKRLVVLPVEAGHGWGMLLGLTAQWSPLAPQVAAFIRHHAG
jgi:pimeloyl-ACP methyl ester carboxylesterase